MIKQEFCCVTFKLFIEDFDYNTRALYIDFDTMQSFIVDYMPDPLNEQRYPLYDFKYCPFCGAKL